MPRMKVCPKPGCPVLIPATRRYCPEHARDYEQRRGSRQQRGYDATHNRLRAAWQARIDAGETIHCATCPTIITGHAWDLGHNHTSGGYLGPQCIPCNRGEAGTRGAAITNQGPP